MTSLLQARDVHRTYELRRGVLGRRSSVPAVRGVSLAIERGTVLGLVGESGCGKSTLARMLMGLEPASSGDVLIGDQPVSRMDRRERASRIQIVFQDPNASLNPRKSIHSILTLPLRVQGEGDAAERRRKAVEMIDLVGLPRRALDSLPGDLSGGQRQRVAIARALILRPEVVICDEPTSALDVSVQAQILNLLMDLQRELGLTYLLISHNLAVVQHMAHRVAVMYLGRVVEENETAELFREPRHPYTRMLLRSVLTPEPDRELPVVGRDAGTGGEGIPGTGCLFRPRCPDALAVCGRVAPEPLAIDPPSDGHVECHLYDPKRGSET